MFEFNEMHAWLLFTAIVFTFVGRYMARSSARKLMHTIAQQESTNTVAAVPVPSKTAFGAPTSVNPFEKAP